MPIPDAIRRARLVCFDNDGTLFASHEVANPAIQRSYVAFCREHGLDLREPSDEAICALTGKPGHEFYREILPPPLKDLAPRFREVCLEEEAREVLARGRFFDGIDALLADLRAAGRKLALVTNAGEVYLGAVRRRMGYDALLDGIYHYGKGGLLRKEEMIRAAQRDLGETRAVMVGDRASDLEGARGAGVPFVGCLFGYGDAVELAAADAMAESVEQLRTILLDGAPARA
jgi:phosphoglycolate phosphatase